MISYSGALLGVLVTAFLYPILLQPEQFGLTRILISFSTVGSQLASLGLRATILRFLPLVENRDEWHYAFVRLLLLLPFAGFILVSLFLVAGEEWILSLYSDSPLFSEYFIWVFPMIFYVVYFEILNSLLRARLDSVTGSVTLEVGLRMYLILILTLYGFSWVNFDGFILLFTSGYGITTVVLLWTLAKRGEFKKPEGLYGPFLRSMKSAIHGLPTRLNRAMIRYSGFTLFSGLAGLMVWNIDVLMLGSYEGLGLTAVYSIAFYMGSVMIIPLRSMERIGTPLIAEYIRKKQWDLVRSIYEKTSLNAFIIALFAGVLIWMNLQLFFSFLPDIYARGLWVVFWIGIGQLVNIAAGLNGSIIATSRYYRVDLYSILILLGLTVLTNLLLIPEYGVNGAAAATCLSLLAYNVFKTVYVKIKFGLQPFNRNFWGFFIGFVPLSVGWVLLPVEEWVTAGQEFPELLLLNADQLQLLLGGGVKSLIFAVVYGAALTFTPFSPDMKMRIYSILTKLGLRIRMG